MFSNRKLSQLCNIISQSNDLPVFLLDEHGSVQFEAASNFMKNPLIQSKEELLIQLYNSDDKNDFPRIRITSYLEYYISIALTDNSGYKGSILVGQIIDSRFTKEMLEPHMMDLNISQDKKEEVISYYQALPIKRKMKIIYIGLQIYYMVYQKALDPVEVIEKNRTIDRQLVEIEDPNISISERRQDVRLHHDLMYEKKILQCIVEGNKQEVIHLIQSFSEAGEMGLLSKKSHVRNFKNLGITVITLATRAAMEGGLQHEIAYSLSDLYIQNLEELNNVKDIESFIEYVLGDLAERVEKSRKFKYSKPINKSLNYIFNHLYDEISLATLADIAGVHPNYLCSIFKKEVGVNIKNYILSAKVEEAKTLMQFTDYSLLKISTLLNFHDQSYFTKIFRNFTGKTPNQYKNNPN